MLVKDQSNVTISWIRDRLET